MWGLCNLGDNQVQQIDIEYPYEVTNPKERAYIRERKLKAFANSLCFYICRIFPIKKSLVSVCTFEGKGGFGCNPKYIVQELHRQDPSIEFVWFVNDMSKEFPDYIKKVPNTLWSRAYWLSRSKVWIDNYRKPYGTVKRKGQYYINTWHANVGFKTIGLWRGKAFSKMAYLVSRNDSKMIDDVLIDSKFCEDMFPRGLVYDGSFLKVGQPRCDILYGDRTEQKIKFREKHHLPKNSKIIMFAPTYREGAKNGKRSVFSEVWTIDFKRMLDNLERKFGGVWYLCVRVHPQLAPRTDEYKNDALAGRVIDVSQDDDMYESLAAMDAFITDYSSAAFDASYTHMPVFIYADDIDQYINDRGSLLWDLSADLHKVVKNNKNMTSGIDVILPFSIAQNNDELETIILDFNQESYNKKQELFEDKVQLIFKGEASNLISRKIKSRVNNCKHTIQGSKNEQ